ncbi:jouberin-like [Hermetia illucens]|uniref:jouberin-like n=1 Tax=Hermetia illucens TaxID=343691 RepID=UPI0018CC0F14|nr:jouberin-like [Hermetia illucens]
MYSKIQESRSFSHSDESESSNKQEDSDSGTDTDTTSEYDSPTSPSATQSERHDNGNSTAQKGKTQISKANFTSKLSTATALEQDIVTSSGTKHRTGKGKKIRSYDSSAFTYETIIGIHLYKTSALKFKKYIRAPRVKVSIYDTKTRLLARKSDVNRNVIINMEPDHVDYILPIMSNEGKLSEDGSFSFEFDENLIINDDIRRIKDENIVILFELVDTVVTNFKTRWKIRNSDGWHYICWGFFKLNLSHDGHINKRRTLQLYKYRKSKRSASILEHWADNNRKKYPGTLEVAIKEVKYQQEEVELSRPHTALQKDKHISEVSKQQQKSSLEYDEKNFIIASTSSNSGNVGALRIHAEKLLPLIKFRKFFRWRTKFVCPTQEIIRKQLARKCSVCRFNEDGGLLAYAEEVGDEAATADIIIAQVSNLVQQYVLKGHTGTVHCLRWVSSVSTTGKQQVGKQVLLSASEDHTCILWYLAAEGNYSLEVLPHAGPIYSADFLHTFEDSNKNDDSRGSITIATGGRNAVLHIWRIDTITRPAPKKSETSTKLRRGQCLRRCRQVHLEAEISKHGTHIVGIAASQEFHRIFTGEVSGVVLEWSREAVRNEDADNVSWINSRSFRISDGLQSLQIVEKIHQSGSVLYASTISPVTTNSTDKVATLHKIDTRTGNHSEISTHTLPTKVIKSTTFSFVVLDCSSTEAGVALLTSDTNKITCINLKSDTVMETVEVNLSRLPTPSKLKNRSPQTGCIKAIDVTFSSAGDSGKSVLAIALSSCKQVQGNYIFLYGPDPCKHNGKMAESTKALQRSRRLEHGLSMSSSRHSGSTSSASSDCKNVSRLTSFFNEVLDKCDRIIRYGSSNTSGYKLATPDEGNSAIDIDGNGDVDSDKTSIKSDKTFTIDNISVNSGSSDRAFGNTFSIEAKRKDVNDTSDANDNTFIVQKPINSDGKKSGVDDTDVSEDMESLS